MKVLLIGQLPKEAGGTYTTGIARVVENLYQKQFGEGIDVFWYFTNVPNDVAQKKCSYRNQYSGYSMNPLVMLWNMMSHPFRMFKEWKQYRISGVNPLRFEFYKANMKRVIDMVKPDLIHLHGAGLPPLYYANRNQKAPIIITFHGVMYNEEDESTWHYKPSYLQHIKLADYFTVLNQETKRKALVLGMPENKCETIPNGVDTTHFYFSEEWRQKLRKDMAVDCETMVFITVGAVIDRKGQNAFLQVLETLGINYQYWIIGKGPDEKKIANYVAEKHLENKVKLMGYVNGLELFKYLSAADIYAHVSTTEGQALSEIEAYATGLRVIVRKEITGTVIGDAEQDNDIYYILDMTHYNKENLVDWISKKNLNRQSRNNIDWAFVAKQYGDLYKNLLTDH